MDLLEYIKNSLEENFDKNLDGTYILDSNYCQNFVRLLIKHIDIIDY